MIATIFLGGVAGWLLLQHSSQRTAVVGISEDVAWGQVVTAADLQSVEVVPDPALLTVAWGDRDSIIGHPAATDLQAGTLATGRSVAAGSQVPGPGQALVGVSVKTGQLPVTSLAARDNVQLVITGNAPAGAATGSPGAATSVIEAVVFTVGPVDGTGTRTVDVLLSSAAAQTVAAAAADDQVSIILVPRG